MQAQNPTLGYQQANKASAQLAIWTLAWVASLALAKFGPTHLWDSSMLLSWGSVTLNVAVGIGWIVAHARYLRGIDELQRKVGQDALAITLGLGWVGGFAYIVADAADLIDRNVSIGLFTAILGIIYIIAIVVGNLRFR